MPTSDNGLDRDLDALGTIEEGGSPSTVWVSETHCMAFVWHGGITLNLYTLPSWYPADAVTMGQQPPDTAAVTDRIAALIRQWDEEARTGDVVEG